MCLGLWGVCVGVWVWVFVCVVEARHVTEKGIAVRGPLISMDLSLVFAPACHAHRYCCG